MHTDSDICHTYNIIDKNKNKNYGKTVQIIQNCFCVLIIIQK